MSDPGDCAIMSKEKQVKKDTKKKAQKTMKEKKAAKNQKKADGKLVK